jgi:DNA-directed RNA polymerase subunit RPC12/RpoP
MMDVLFYCARCDQQIEAAPDMVGEHVACPTCGIEVQVPDVKVRDDENREAVVNFDCPHCTHNIDAPSRATGAMVRCPACNGRILIPGRVEPIATAEEMEAVHLPKPPGSASDPAVKGSTQRIHLPEMPPPPARHMKIKRRTE